MMMGSAKVGHRLHDSSFRYRSRGSDATTALSFGGGTPPVYSVQHDVIVMSSWVDSHERCFSQVFLPPYVSFVIVRSEANLWRSARISSASAYSDFTQAKRGDLLVLLKTLRFRAVGPTKTPT